jgi:hypothetical protein
MADLAANSTTGDAPGGIPASNPTVSQLVFTGDGIRQPLSGQAFFTKGHKAEDGTWTIDDEVKTNLYIPDIWAKAATDPEVANAITALVTVLTKLGYEAGVL